MVRLRVLGEMVVERDGERLALPPSRRTRALLAYLALTGRPHRRGRLCALFWDSPDDPRGALRWSLSRLRPLVDEPGRPRIVADRETVAFAAKGAEVDVLALRARLEGDLEAVPEPHLAVAAEALAGGLLEDQELPDCREFQAWLVAEREDLRRLRERVLRALVARQSDRPEKAARHARALVAAEPFQPSAHLLLLRLLVAAGREGEARLAYEAARRALREAGPAASWAIDRAWRELTGEPRGAEAAPAAAGHGGEGAGSVPELDEGPSLAVLPFDNLTGDPGQEQIVDGIVEEITAVLSRVRPLRVIARNSAFVYKGRNVDARQAARELRVRYLLEGSVRRRGDRLRITAQLIDGSGFHLWSETYEGPAEDIFGLQDRLTVGVAGVMLPTVMASEVAAARRKRPENLTAYDLTMRAMPHVWSASRSTIAEALELLERAIALDPAYALAHALASRCHGQRVIYSWARDVAGARRAALDHARRALELDSRDPLVLTMLGTAETLLGELEAAAVHIARALALDPNSAWAWNRSGWIEVYFDRPAAAIERFERAVALSPFDPMLYSCHFGIGCAHWVAGRPAEAIASAERALVENPEATWILSWSAAWMVEAGHLEQARTTMARVRKDYPELTVAWRRAAMPPFRTPGLIERYLEALRAAGLPE